VRQRIGETRRATAAATSLFPMARRDCIIESEQRDNTTMGISNTVLQAIEENIRRSIGDIRGINMLELGNQELGASSSERTAKQYFEARGVNHTSIDLNGLDGAVVVDLSKPSDRSDWIGHFDVVTNCGTTEHVDPYDAQYEAFRNIHTWLRPGGIAIHVLPDVHALEEYGTWRGHCENYYSREFVEMLATANGYKILDMQFSNNVLVFCLRKTRDVPFMSDRATFISHVSYRKGGQRLRGKLREIGLYPRRSTIKKLQGLLTRS